MHIFFRYAHISTAYLIPFSKNLLFIQLLKLTLVIEFNLTDNRMVEFSEILILHILTFKTGVKI